MHATDRVVLVAAGFGVWQGGRHVASARWTDVERVVAVRSETASTPRLRVMLRLQGVDDVFLAADLPGFEHFLAVAEQSLPGMRRSTSWRKVEHPGASVQQDLVLFDRTVRSGRA